MVNIKNNSELHRKELEVLITNVGQATLENWQFEMNLPHEVIRDTRDTHVRPLLETLVH